MKRHTDDDVSPGLRVRIRVGGQLDAGWSAWFEGLSVTALEGEATLDGVVADQAALHGLLSRIRDLGVPLIGLEVVGAADRTRGDAPSASGPHGPDASREPRSGSGPA